MINDAITDFCLTGNANLVAELIDEMHSWPDINPDVLAALLEFPDTVMELTHLWPW